MSADRYRVELAPAAQRQLGHLPPGVAAALRGPILALALDPRPPGVTKLAGSNLWRLRVGDLRLIYLIDDRDRLVVVLRVARRSESTYRRVR
ncbi:MAG: type II toxin-antitoxin system RelE/ParE family toxin [Chloroflexi bacterium]|nr:type II toxin-antitoxin system RelE/ParE family toxin [Chloroflexota bacterium]